jgi:small subunit ribosomal protein S19
VSRSIKKGPFIAKHLYKRVLDKNKTSDKKIIKTYSRCSTVIPEMVGMTISVYNGKTWIPVYVTENLVGINWVNSRRQGCSGGIPVLIKRLRQSRVEI